MDLLKTDDSRLFIPKSIFDTCLIDGATRQQILRKYEGRHNGVYYINKFDNYLKDNHDIDLKEYCIKYLEITWPKCPIRNVDLFYLINGKGLTFSKFSLGGCGQEFSPKFKESVERMKIVRRGAGNPMFGKDPWNLGLKAETDERMAKIVEKMKLREIKESTREKYREIRRLSPMKARHTTPHSPETVEKMREITAARWASGSFSKVTSIHIKMREFLQTLDLKENFTEEFLVKYFSLDFAFPEAKIGIECQGTYYHIDPRVYPNGPKNAMQRRNLGRDKVKKQYLEDRNGWIIIEAWEIEINDGSFKEDIKCRLQELNLLKA
jgi:hypothetical protein